MLPLSLPAGRGTEDRPHSIGHSPCPCVISTGTRIVHVRCRSQHRAQYRPDRNRDRDRDRYRCRDRDRDRDRDWYRSRSWYRSRYRHRYLLVLVVVPVHVPPVPAPVPVPVTSTVIARPRQKVTTNSTKRRDPSTPPPDGSYFPIHKITEPEAVTRSISGPVHCSYGTRE